MYNRQSYLRYKVKNPWMPHFSAAKQRCNRFKAKRFKDYGGRGIKFLLTKEEIKELWFRDKAYEMKRPSIDREDNDGNYEFSNCRFMELKENNFRSVAKPVLQFSKEGKFIKEWSCSSEAQKVLGLQDICHALKERQKTCGKFIWKYKEI